MYFPPAGGGGVQRTLKTATHLPGLGIETHVLAPDDPKWVHRDDELEPPTQAWVPPRALHRSPRTTAGAGAARQAGPRAGRHPGQALRPPAARPRRERHLEPDRDPGGDPDRTPRGHRRRPHHLAAQLGALRRRGGEARDRRPLGRRPPRLARRPPAPPRRRAAAGPDQGAGRARRRGAGRGLRRRDRRRCRRHRRGGTRLRAERPRGDDRERGGLRRLRRDWSSIPRRASGSRTPAASSAGATRGRSSPRWPSPDST